VNPKIACGPSLKTTIHYTALANISGPPLGYCPGRLQDVWLNCYGGGAYPTCKNGSAPQFDTRSALACESIENILGVWTGYPNVTYAQQRAIIDWARAQANLNKPSCSNGGQMILWDLGFCRDAFVYDAICVSAKYYCCPN
jgi:hypothetical protein